MPEISIITNVYDAKDYLPLTVKSILDGTFKDLELLLVEDGSPNGCGELCDRLAETDPRIRVFHKPNGGPASASNVGLDNARGRYIGFVDSDDLIEPDMFQKLYDAIEQSGCPMAACCADTINEDGKVLPGNKVESSVYGKQDALSLFNDAFRTGTIYGPLSWNKLIARHLYTDKKVRYDEKMLYGDDASVLHRLFEGETIFCLPDVLYHYRTRTGSITAGRFHPRKLDDLTMYWDWICYFRAKDGYKDTADWAVARYWQVFYQFYCLACEAGMEAQLKPEFAFHLGHLKQLMPDLLACPHISAFEKNRARLFVRSPAAAYRLARTWGRLHGA